jgi:hypothetical protein
MIKVIPILIGLTIANTLAAQDAGTIHFGPYSRYENNLYKYQSNSNGTFSSVRGSNGYSAGLELNAIIQYLVKVDFRVGFSEMNYSPNYTNTNSEMLYNNNVRAVQFAGNIHLRLGGKPTFYPSVFIGTQVNTVREATINGRVTNKKDIWIATRSFGTVGLAGNFLMMKERLLVKPELGMRLKFIGKRGWENSPNQVFIGVSVGYRLKN